MKNILMVSTFLNKFQIDPVRGGSTKMSGAK